MPYEPLPDPEAARAPVPLTAVLERLAARMGATQPRVATSLYSIWPNVVGQLVGSNSRPVRVKDGVLTVDVPDAAWRTQLQFLADDVIKRLTETLGADAPIALDVRVARKW